MLSASIALIREAFSDTGRRARALGVWAVGGAGPLLGGLLTTVDWRLVFAINIHDGTIGFDSTPVIVTLTVAAASLLGFVAV